MSERPPIRIGNFSGYLGDRFTAIEEALAGDPVDVVTAAGVLVGRGLVNYDSSELPALAGRTTRDLARELGSSYEREVIHRDDLVLLTR